MAKLIEELTQIPEALDNLVAYYQSEGKHRLLTPKPQQILLTGMGASYHAALIGAVMFQQAGIASHAIEASDFLFPSKTIHQSDQTTIYLSQSGSSGEVKPFLESCADPDRLFGITNQADSPLGQQAGHLLPMIAGDEQWIASKTYINSIALLWLLAQAWESQELASSLDELKRISEHISWIQAHSATLIECLEDAFSNSERVIFLGAGPHGTTARQTSMTLSEWPKLTSLHFSLGAFRHGFIEIADAKTSTFIFSPPGNSRASATSLADELSSYGSQCTLIENGTLYHTGQPAHNNSCRHELLSPILDIIPIQLFAEVLARKRFDPTGFRYIGKVVTNL